LTFGGVEDRAVIAIRAVRDEVRAVDLDDMAAQRAATVSFNKRFAELRDV